MSKHTPLQELGLSKGAEDIYLSLIEHGPMMVTDISRSTDQFRADTYRHIEELLASGLILSIVYGKRKRYDAVSPESILGILRKKEVRITDSVTELLQIFDRREGSFQTEVFEGKKGIESLYRTLVLNVKRKAQLCRIESPRDYKVIKKYYPKEYWNRAGFRSGGDIEKFVITNPVTRDTRQKNLNRSSKDIPSKFLPFDHNFTTLIIEDRVAIIDFDLEKGLLIKNERYAEYMKDIFWMLYEALR